MPPWLGTKIMPVGAILAIFWASYTAPLRRSMVAKLNDLAAASIAL